MKKATLTIVKPDAAYFLAAIASGIRPGNSRAERYQNEVATRIFTHWVGFTLTEVFWCQENIFLSDNIFFFTVRFFLLEQKYFFLAHFFLLQKEKNSCPLKKKSCGQRKNSFVSVSRKHILGIWNRFCEKNDFLLLVKQSFFLLVYWPQEVSNQYGDLPRFRVAKAFCSLNSLLKRRLD